MFVEAAIRPMARAKQKRQPFKVAGGWSAWRKLQNIFLRVSADDTSKTPIVWSNTGAPMSVTSALCKEGTGTGGLNSAVLLLDLHFITRMLRKGNPTHYISQRSQGWSRVWDLRTKPTSATDLGNIILTSLCPSVSPTTNQRAALISLNERHSVTLLCYHNLVSY